MGSKKTSETTEVHVQTPEEYIAEIARFHLPRYDEIPDLDLYMDQLIKYVGDHVNVLEATVDKALTPSMVNNYVKQKLVPQPKSKRYERIHVVYLIAVCVMKRTFSIADIDRLIELEVHHRYEVPETYDFFCTAFEETLRVLFCGQASADQVGDLKLVNNGEGFAIQVENIQDIDDDHRVAIAAATSAACKVYVDKQLDWLQAVSHPESE